MDALKLFQIYTKAENLSIEPEIQDRERKSYSQIFIEIIDNVQKMKIFKQDDLDKFFALDHDALKLLVRVYMRKEGWIKLDSINYSEIENLDQALQQCVEMNLILDESFLFKSVSRSKSGSKLDLEDQLNNFIKQDISQETLDITQLLNLLGLEQIKSLEKIYCKSARVKAATKTDKIQSIAKQVSTQGNLFGKSQFDKLVDQIKSLLGSVLCLRNSVRSLIKHIHLAYFAYTSFDQIDQTMQDEILVNLQRRIYPKYELNSDGVFLSQGHLVLYDTSLRMYRQLDTYFQQKQYQSIANVYHLLKEYFFKLQMEVDQIFKEQDQIKKSIQKYVYNPIMIYSKALVVLSKALAKVKQFDSEFEIIQLILSCQHSCQEKRGYLWDRILLLSERRVDIGECESENDFKSAKMQNTLQLASQALIDTSIAERYKKSIIDRVKRLEKRLKVEQSILLNSQDFSSEDNIPFEVVQVQCTSQKTIGNKSRWMSKLLEFKDQKLDFQQQEILANLMQKGATVEQVALEHYISQGWDGLICEGGPVRMIYSLLFHDVIFDSTVSGALVNPYHTQPLDFNTELFYPNRKEIIDLRLKYIESESDGTLALLVSQYNKLQGVMCFGLQWGYQLNLLTDIFSCLKPCQLSGICRIFSQMPRQLNGLPDLLLYNTEKKTLRFVEIKGPGDSLMDHQYIWLSEMLKLDIDCFVCKIVDLKQSNVETVKST